MRTSKELAQRKEQHVADTQNVNDKLEAMIKASHNSLEVKKEIVGAIQEDSSDELLMLGSRKNIGDEFLMLRNANYSMAEIKEACPALIAVAQALHIDFQKEDQMDGIPSSDGGPNEHEDFWEPHYSDPMFVRLNKQASSAEDGGSDGDELSEFISNDTDPPWILDMGDEPLDLSAPLANAVVDSDSVMAAMEVKDGRASSEGEKVITKSRTYNLRKRLKLPGRLQGQSHHSDDSYHG